MNTEKAIRPEVKSMSAYIPGARAETVSEKYGVDVDTVIKLASNENPFGVSPMAVKAMLDNIGRASVYPDSTMKVLRKKIAEKKDVEWEQVMVGPGGGGCLQTFAETFLSKGDEIIIGNLAFYGHKVNGDLMGAKTVVVPMHPDYRYDFDAVLGAVTEKTKVIYITNPNNPSGVVTTGRELEPFLEKVPSDVFVVLDEAYYEFAVENPDYPDSISYLKKHDNLVIMRTFSKISGLAGLRVGYMISTKEIVHDMLRALPTFAVSTLALEAASAAVDDAAFINRTLDGNRESLDMFMRYFDKNNYHYIRSGANFIFVDLGVDSRELHEKLCAKGLILRPGYFWGKQNWMRISFGTKEQTEAAISILDSVLKEK